MDFFFFRNEVVLRCVFFGDLYVFGIVGIGGIFLLLLKFVELWRLSVLGVGNCELFVFCMVCCCIELVDVCIVLRLVFELMDRFELYDFLVWLGVVCEDEGVEIFWGSIEGDWDEVWLLVEIGGGWGSVVEVLVIGFCWMWCIVDRCFICFVLVGLIVCVFSLVVWLVWWVFGMIDICFVEFGVEFLVVILLGEWGIVMVMWVCLGLSVVFGVSIFWLDLGNGCIDFVLDVFEFVRCCMFFIIVDWGVIFIDVFEVLRMGLFDKDIVLGFCFWVWIFLIWVFFSWIFLVDFCGGLVGLGLEIGG